MIYINEKQAPFSYIFFISKVITVFGQIINVEILKGINDGELLEKEAVRLKEPMPKWNTKNSVNVQMTLPVKFQIKR